MAAFGESERPWLIDRPRLIEKLDDSRFRNIVIVAPAGYGKSTLARQFVTARAERHVWLQCTKSSADVGRLAAQLAQALAGGDEMTVLAEAFASLAATAARNQEASIGDAIGDAVELWPPELWLVADDYEQIAGESAAEGFLGRLAVDSGIRTIVASRVRPAWLTARRVTYGDVIELDARELAMTADEAAAIFIAVGREPAKDLVALADGWPAALTLVALGGSDAASLTGTLEEFVAEEVCRSFTGQVRMDLSLLAGLSTINAHSVSVMLGEHRTQCCLDTAREAGVIEKIAEGSFEFHPLVRDYLRGQPFKRGMVKDATAAAERLADYGAWDDLFDVAARVGSEAILALLLTKGVRVALDEGRASSVRRWLDYARLHRMCDSLVRLGEAELALRDGFYVQSETLGAEVAGTLEAHPGARTWALFIAGRAAHLAGREERAVEYYRMARLSATTDAERREADWGELKGAIDLELPEAPSLLSRLRGSEQTTAADRVEVASRSLVLGARLGSLEAIDAARAVLQIVPYVSDPVARTSFRNTFAYACAIAGEYEDALDALDALEADAESRHLLFTLPYVACARAVVDVARRKFDAAFSALTNAAIEARRVGDSHVLGMCAAIRSRALIALGRFTEASATASFRHPSLIRSMHGELLATRALALSCSGDQEQASLLAQEAASLSTAVEVLGIALCIDAIAEARLGSTSADHAAENAAVFARESRYVDGLITACRGFPEFARRIAATDQHSDWLLELMRRTNDVELAQIAGHGRRAGEHHLSRREAEVFALLRQGFSNKEIGARLFITEDTAKQHVHKIFRKLGVRTRTEAALKVPPPV